MISVVGLTKRYGDHLALDDVDIEVPAGAVYGLVGPNGAGKTTMLAILSRLRRPTEGDVVIDAPRSRVALLPDAPRFERWLTGREVVELSRSFASGIEEEATERVLVQAGLAEAADRRVGGYSRGMLQRLGLAATVVGSPNVLLLDEPASALDPAGRRQVLDLVSEMRGSATVVFSSHILEDVESVCDRVGILARGKLVFDGPTDELLASAASRGIRITVRGDAPRAAAVFEDVEWVATVNVESSTQFTLAVTSLDAAQQGLAPRLAMAEVRLVSVEPTGPSLEALFLELTS